MKKLLISSLIVIISLFPLSNIVVADSWEDTQKEMESIKNRLKTEVDTFDPMEKIKDLPHGLNVEVPTELTLKNYKLSDFVKGDIPEIGEYRALMESEFQKSLSHYQGMYDSKKNSLESQYNKEEKSINAQKNKSLNEYQKSLLSLSSEFESDSKNLQNNYNSKTTKLKNELDKENKQAEKDLDSSYSKQVKDLQADYNKLVANTDNEWDSKKYEQAKISKAAMDIEIANAEKTNTENMKVIEKMINQTLVNMEAMKNVDLVKENSKIAPGIFSEYEKTNEALKAKHNNMYNSYISSYKMRSFEDLQKNLPKTRSLSEMYQQSNDFK